MTDKARLQSRIELLCSLILMDIDEAKTKATVAIHKAKVLFESEKVELDQEGIEDLQRAIEKLWDNIRSMNYSANTLVRCRDGLINRSVDVLEEKRKREQTS